MSLRSLWWAAALLVATIPAPAVSQQAPRDPRRGQATRPDLETLLALYQSAAASPAYSDTLRRRAQFDAGLVRERLERGDFQIGDRVELVVEEEATLTGTFVVMDGPLLRLPLVGDVSLAGVLRSELEEHLRAQMGRFLENPRVIARSFIRISILGAVPRPGFYPAPSDGLVSDVLMLAGGPVPLARVDDMAIEREGRRIWFGDQVRRAIIEGRTIDQLGVRTGDRLSVPQRSSGLWAAGGVLQMVTLLMSLPLTVFGLVSVF